MDIITTELSVEDLETENLDGEISLEENSNEQSKLEVLRIIFDKMAYTLLCFGELVLNFGFLVYITGNLNPVTGKKIVDNQFTKYVECILNMNDAFKDAHSYEQLIQVKDTDYYPIIREYTNKKWQPVLKTVQDMNTSEYSNQENNLNLVKLLGEQPEIVIELLRLFEDKDFKRAFENAEEDTVIKKMGVILESWYKQYDTICQRKFDPNDTKYNSVTYRTAFEEEKSTIHDAIKHLLLDQEEWNVYCGKLKESPTATSEIEYRLPAAW